MARIPYVEKETAPQEVAELFAKMQGNTGRVSNLWRMAAHSPSTLIHFIKMGNSILTKTRISPKLREMAIVRQAVAMGCEYERGGHAMFGKEVGVTDRQIAEIGDWQKSGAFDEAERAVLQFVDEVSKDGKVSDKTFNDLSKHLDNGMMVELATTVGFYGMIARILLPFQVDLEPPPKSSSQIVGRPKK